MSAHVSSTVESTDRQETGKEVPQEEREDAHHRPQVEEKVDDKIEPQPLESIHQSSELQKSKNSLTDSSEPNIKGGATTQTGNNTASGETCSDNTVQDEAKQEGLKSKENEQQVDREPESKATSITQPQTIDGQHQTNTPLPQAADVQLASPQSSSALPNKQ